MLLIGASFEIPDLCVLTINVEDLDGARRGSNLVAGWKGVKAGLRGHERRILKMEKLGDREYGFMLDAY